MMTNDDNEFYPDDFEVAKSKTKIKKEMLALQDLGEALTHLNAKQQATIPMGDDLRRAVEDAPKITQNSAKKRHLQYIGRLMRESDAEAIQKAYDQLQTDAVRLTQQHHQIEQWRDDLLANDNAQAVNAFFTQFPDCDRQQLNQILRTAKKEASENKPPASARKLFKFIRETIATQL